MRGTPCRVMAWAALTAVLILLTGRVAGHGLDSETSRPPAHRTAEAMRAGPDVIPQAAFVDERGRADFLRRSERRTRFGSLSPDLRLGPAGEAAFRPPGSR